jgi:hypothetical protein
MICRNCKVEVDGTLHSNVECIAYLRSKLERVTECLKDFLDSGGDSSDVKKALTEIENSIPVGL